MIIGYARVSTEEQHLDAQISALEATGAERIFSEKVSGTKRTRPELNRMIEQLRDGDVVVVTKYDRLSRSFAANIQMCNLDVAATDTISRAACLRQCKLNHPMSAAGRHRALPCVIFRFMCWHTYTSDAPSTARPVWRWGALAYENAL